MASRNSAALVIIKRKKISGDGRHHGGAWKVAYADFVTAMMAFFLMMWLLGATTEQQRRGVADYFSPVASVSPSGGGTNVLGGDSSFTQETMAHNGTGVAGGRDPTAMTEDQLQEAKAAVDKALTAFGGESMTMEARLRHVVTKVTDEGLTIEVFDLEDSPLFAADSAEPAPALREIVTMVAEILPMTCNGIAVNGHVRAYPAPLRHSPVWDLSAARAGAVRALLEADGLPQARLRRVVGHADRKPVAADPMAIRNNRVEIVLLRRDR
ncbi:MAG: OmpA family protein [Gemmobacter sp.]|nr:OmpA family protein [Gemmobacter sp.]